MAEESYKIELIIDAKDNSAQTLSQAEERINRFQQKAQLVNKQLSRSLNTQYKTTLTAVDKTTSVVNSVERSLSRVPTKYSILIAAKDMVSSVVPKIGSALQTALNKSVGMVKGAFSTMGRIVSSPFTWLGVAAGGAGMTAAITAPLKLAGNMEQARLAFKFFLGSEEKARKFVAEMQQMAAITPFEYKDIQELSTMLIPLYSRMYGVNNATSKTLETLRLFADAGSMTGAGMEGIQGAMLGFTQIAQSGRLNLQDLRQVTLGLRIPMEDVLKNLGVKSLDDISKKAIPARKAMEAILKTLEKYKGGSEVQARTLQGMMSTIKDTLTMTITQFGEGMLAPVEGILKEITDALTGTGSGVTALEQKLFNFGRQVGNAFVRMYEGVKKFVKELTSLPGWEDMSLLEKLTATLEKVLDGMLAWIKGDGKKQIDELGTTLGDFFSGVFDDMLPKVLPKAVDFATKLVEEVGKAVWNAIKTNKVLMTLLGASIGYQFFGWKGAFVGAGLGFGGSLVAEIAENPTPHRQQVLDLMAQGYTRYEAEQLIKKGNVLPYGNSKSQKVSEQAILDIISQFEKEAGLVETPTMTATQDVNNVLLPLSINEGVKKAIDTITGTVTKHALGGIFTKPHIGVVAERSAEAVIPLTRTQRAYELWQKAGVQIGALNTAYPTETKPVVRVESGAKTSKVVNVNLDTRGLVEEVVINNQADVDKAVDKIVDTLAPALRKAFSNMVVG